MSTRKTTLFYAVLIAVASMAVGMVIASRLELTPASMAQTTIVPVTNKAPLTGPIDAQTFRNIAKAQSPMVVNIRTEMKARGQDFSDFGGAPDDLFRRFFGGPDDQDGQDQGGDRRRQREPRTQAAGTGFIVSKDGFILTNNHVVADATKIEVSLYGEDADFTYQAKVIGKDAFTDVALIQLTEKPDHALPEATFGDSSQVAAGDWVVAIGNPFNYAHTVTVGVISATERAFPIADARGRSNEMLQTDAAINPGNSGGPLLNVRGEVIGINTAIISNERAAGNIGIGFAVPINTVRDLLDDLRKGKVSRGKIGLSVLPVPREAYQDFGLRARTGALVASVVPRGPSAKAGIQPGDVVIEYNGRPVPSSGDLVKMVLATKPGTSVPIKVMRNKQERTLSATVEELDLEAEQQQARGGGNDQEPDEQSGGGFGITLGNLTPERARRLQVPSGEAGALVTDVDPNGPAAGALRPGDVILSVNGNAISSAAEAGRELQQVPAGRIARILLWRDAGQVFVPLKKE